jgi:F-type H+-transporting ATPase subunit alpha
VGGAAQTKLIKSLSGGIRTDLAQYRELAAFAQFASDLDEATRRQLDRGARVTELLKQQQYSPLAISIMGLSLFAINKGYFDDVEVGDVLKVEKELQTFFEADRELKSLLEKIQKSEKLDENTESSLAKGIEEFKKTIGK